MSETTEIRGRLVDGGERVALLVRDGRVTDIRTLDAGIDAEGEERWLAPGLVDLQVNGYAGFDLNAAGGTIAERADAVRRMTRALVKSGTTTFCPTIITASSEQVAAAMTAVRLACEQDPFVNACVAGIHLEGPYLSALDGPRGAHPLPHVRDPDWREFASWNEASGGRIRLVTLAPERPGAIPFIRRLVEAGIVACLGHTAATEEEIGAAAAAGATMSTHLGNGSHTSLPRHPNYIWAQLADDRLTPSIIADGHHLPPSVVRVFARAKQRVALVSDAVHLAGLPPGTYETHIGGKVTLLPSGRLHTAADLNILAGAAASLFACVRNYCAYTGESMASAFRAAAAVPADIAGDPAIGRLRPGMRADVLAFRRRGEDGEWAIEAVYKRGELMRI